MTDWNIWNGLKTVVRGARFSRLTPDARVYVLNSSLQTARDVLVNLFVLIFIWKIDQNLMTTCKFRLGAAVIIPFFSVVGGILAHKLDRIWTFRLGILLYLPFFLLLILLGKHSAYYALLLGGAAGVAEGIYWSGRQTLDFEHARGRNSAYFLGLQSALSGIVAMLMPVLSGFIIEKIPPVPLLGSRSGYVLIFGVAILIAVAGLLMTLVYTPDRHRGRLKYWKAFVPHKNNPAWSIILVYHVLSGFRSTILLIFSAVLFYSLVKSEFAVGGVHTLGAVLSVVIIYFLGHVVSRKNRLPVYAIGIVLFVCSSSLLFFKISVVSLTLFVLFQRLSEGFFRLPVSTIRYDAIRSDPAHKEAKIEYNIAFEPYIALGRVSAVLVMMMFVRHFLQTGAGQMASIRYCVIFLCVLPLFEFLLMAAASRQIRLKGVMHEDMTN